MLEDIVCALAFVRTILSDTPSAIEFRLVRTNLESAADKLDFARQAAIQLEFARLPQIRIPESLNTEKPKAM